MISLTAGFFLFIQTIFGGCPDAALTITVHNIQDKGGYIWVGIYDSPENFLIQERARVEGFEVTQTGTMELRIPNLPSGTYAMAVFHDENNNGYLDQNAIGIPKEPYVFSKAPKSKWRLPRFEEVAIPVNACDRLSLTLDKWW